MVAIRTVALMSMTNADLECRRAIGLSSQAMTLSSKSPRPRTCRIKVVRINGRLQAQSADHRNGSVFPIPRLYDPQAVSNESTETYTNSLLHALAEVYQCLVKRVHANQAEARVFDVRDHVHRNGHRGREQQHVQPVARSRRAHVEAREHHARQRD